MASDKLSHIWDGIFGKKAKGIFANGKSLELKLENSKGEKCCAMEWIVEGRETAVLLKQFI
jgi:hypothetical protein